MKTEIVGSPTQPFDGQTAAENAYSDSGTSPPTTSHNGTNRNLTESVTISAGQQTTGQLGGFQLARRRYQKGHVYLRGKREKVWIGRWLEDELQFDGTVVRRHKSEVVIRQNTKLAVEHKSLVDLSVLK